LDCALLTSTVAVTRFVFRSHDLYDLDSVNFALALDRFDPRVHQPHPPGYFLYICLGRLLNSMVHDANLALVLLSIAASCGAVIMIYLLALDWFGARAARFAGILFLFSPLAWFHGTVALTYSVEAFLSSLVGYLCWRVVRGNMAYALPTAVILGISAGIRPSSILFLGPLFLFSLRTVELRTQIGVLAALACTLAAWFVPMVAASGGWGAYIGALLSLWQMVPAKTAVWNSSPATSIARACTIALIYLLCFGAASPALLGAVGSDASADQRKRNFTIAWIAPALCFFTLVFLKFVNSGYLLLLLPAGCVWLGYGAGNWYYRSGWRRPFKLAVVAGCAAANVLIFLASPLYCSYRSVRRFERNLASVRAALPQVGSTDDTLIIAFDSHFLGYRHAGYYLPGYVTVEYPEARLGEGTRIFVMHQRDTRLVAELPGSPYRRFVLFPLPDNDAEYREYLQTVVRKLPNQRLRVLRAGGRDFVTGSVADLPLLFPHAAPQSVTVLLQRP
jgi:hypothetical protein